MNDFPTRIMCGNGASLNVSWTCIVDTVFRNELHLNMYCLCKWLSAELCIPGFYRINQFYKQTCIVIENQRLGNLYIYMRIALNLTIFFSSCLELSTIHSICSFFFHFHPNWPFIFIILDLLLFFFSDEKLLHFVPSNRYLFILWRVCQRGIEKYVACKRYQLNSEMVNFTFILNVDLFIIY